MRRNIQSKIKNSQPLAHNIDDCKKPIYNCGCNKNVKGRMISKNVLGKKRKKTKFLCIHSRVVAGLISKKMEFNFKSVK